MDWTAGYASDIEYTAGFYREQTPAYLNFVCALNGVETVDVSRPFTYCELGFGRGVTVSLLAATNPQGQFYAADFNPAHVAGASKLANAAQLPNLTLLENSFEELAKGAVDNLPQFDFITLHGIYTWVTKKNQDWIVDFLARYLKPGGIVYLSYNAMPGWSSSLPLQRLLVEHADLHPGRSDSQIQGAAEFVAQLETAGANFFSNNPGLKPRLDALKSGNRNYLVHEYMHNHWQPLYHADVARALGNAKLDFVAAAELAMTYSGLYLREDQRAVVDAIADSPLRETVKDYFLNTTFRKDVFVKGMRKMGGQRQNDCLGQMGVALVVPRKDVKLTMQLSVGEVNGREDLYGPVLDALAARPHSISELMALPGLANQTFSNVTQVVAILTASGQARVYSNFSAKVAVDASLRMNRAVAAQVRYNDELQQLGSPLLGSAIATNIVERMVYLVLAQQLARSDEVKAIVGHVWKMMSNQGRRLMRDGTALEGEAENLTELDRQVREIVECKLPIWKQLKML